LARSTIEPKTKTKMPKQKQKTKVHHPVLLKEVLRCLNPKAGQSYLDLTAGYGGHAASVIEVTGTPEQAVLVDRDETAVQSLRQRFTDGGIKIIRSDFLSALIELAGESQKFDMVLADLGVSSPHLEDSERGFSFNLSGPLDMRMDQRQELDAGYIVNKMDEPDLAAILEKYGEEPRAKVIARAITSNRPVKGTPQLAEIVTRAVGWRGRRARINPATKTFQAIRIAVNDELKQLEKSLPLMVDALQPHGRLAIISFHSLEDRLVKQFFADRAGMTYDAELTLLTKKPITAGSSEIAFNPRARSAKLRAAQQK
jgi:16S rRNA (cytosine1402-N4)-methyltransferase